MNREALEDFIPGIEHSWGTGANAARFAPEQSKDRALANRRAQGMEQGHGAVRCVRLRALGDISGRLTARVIMKADHDMIACFDLSETHHDYEAPTCRPAVRRIFNLLRIINEGTK